MFEVLFPQAILNQLPLQIVSIDQHEDKLFVGTSDGSILEYQVVEDPFTITLLQVLKEVTKPLKTLLILPKSRSLGLRSTGNGKP